jgi:predicted dehydrogenase
MRPKSNRRRTGHEIPRRTFLKGVLTASATSPFLIMQTRAKAAESGPTAGKVAPSERVNLACCGIGNRGADDVESMYSTGLANLVAFCDVDMGGPQTQKILKRFPDVPRFKDFREMLDKMGKDIDAVTAGVPDHSHFPIVMQAMSMGKHVYVEKPMGHTFQEVELMMRAEKKYKVAAQMGNQGHSGKNYFQFKAWAEAGIIKDVTRITAFMNSSRRWHGWEVSALPPEEPIPDTLDWDKWLAAAQFHRYNRKYVQGDWRCWYDFGNGALGDWGAHILDTAHRFLDMGLPEEVAAVNLEGHNPFIFPQASTLSFKFPARSQMPPVEILWYDGVKNLPPLPKDFGESALSGDVPPPTSGRLDTAKLAPGKVIYSNDLTFKGGSHSSTLEIIPKSKMKEMESKLPQVQGNNSDHFKNFLLACKGQEKCRSSFDVAGPLSQVLVLGVIAQRLNTKLAFDRTTKQITNNKVANDLLIGPPPRKGWEQYYRL